MATIKIEMTVGANTQTETITAPDARAIEFLDDLRNLAFVEEPLLTRVQVGERYLRSLKANILRYSRSLERERLDQARPAASDLEGN